MPRRVRKLLCLALFVVVGLCIVYRDVWTQRFLLSSAHAKRKRMKFTQQNEGYDAPLSIPAGDTVGKPIEPSVPEGLKPCRRNAPFKGKIQINISPVKLPDLASNFTFLKLGGRWRPEYCVAQHRVAIIIPVRDRVVHLGILLRHLHPFLLNQELDYGMFVIEQTQEEMFNKAVMFNAGFLEITKRFGNYYDCYILHDVDLLPEDDRIVYNCSHPPRHLGAYVDRVQYRAAYSFCSGGVMEITGEDFRRVNGYSNLYFGWGAEDDDFSMRMYHAKLKFTRYPQDWAHYTSIRHGHSKPNPRGYRYFRKGTKRIDIDGLNTTRYKLVDYIEGPLFTHVLVQVNHLEIFRDFSQRAMHNNRSLEWLQGELGNDTFSILGIDTEKYVNMNNTF